MVGDKEMFTEYNSNHDDHVDATRVRTAPSVTKSLDLPIPEDYVPGEGELNNIVYLICKYTVGWAMRSADLQICKQMVGDIRGNAGLSRLCEVTCSYLWDHICGEPDDFTPDQLFDHIKPGLQEFFNQSVEERNDIG